jgi:formate dehydrogenase major subunit
VGNDGHTAALRAIDKLLAERPEKVGPDFSSATSLLVALRDSQIARWRHSNAEPDHQRLALINSVLSVVIGGHFPPGGIPWPQIEKAREVLASLAE